MHELDGDGSSQPLVAGQPDGRRGSLSEALREPVAPSDQAARWDPGGLGRCSVGLRACSVGLGRCGRIGRRLGHGRPSIARTRAQGPGRVITDAAGKARRTRSAKSVTARSRSSPCRKEGGLERTTGGGEPGRRSRPLASCNASGRHPQVRDGAGARLGTRMVRMLPPPCADAAVPACCSRTGPRPCDHGPMDHGLSRAPTGRWPGPVTGPRTAVLHRP